MLSRAALPVGDLAGVAAVVFFVVRVGHRIEEHLEAGQAAGILGRAAPFPVDEARGYLTSDSPGLTVSTVMVRCQSSPIRARLPQNTAYIRALV